METHKKMRPEPHITFACLMAFLLSVVQTTDVRRRDEVDKDNEFDVESVRRQLISDIDHVVKCRRLPGI